MIVAALLTLSMLGSQEPAYKPIVIHGTLIGVDGNPVPNGIVGDHPSLTDKGDRYKFKEGVTSDAQGRFTITVKVPRDRFELSAFSSSQDQGGYVLESKKNADTLVIKMQPIYPVSYEFVIPPALKKNKVDATIHYPESGVWFHGVVPYKGIFRLPRGPAALLGEIPFETNTLQQKIVVDSGPVKLPPAKFTMTPFALKYGKPPLPLLYKGSKGLAKPFKWSDYKGKWVFVEQWAYWCVPCCFEGLPALMRFANANKDKKDKLAILTLHTVPDPDSKVSDFKTLQPLLDPIEKRAWGGKPLPFPILLDLEGRTMKSWGFHSADVRFLVDPSGNIVRGNPYEVLEKNGFKVDWD